jgi:hypothetical protein
MAAIKVSEAAAKPGVFEKISMNSPRKKPHSKLAHFG